MRIRIPLPLLALLAGLLAGVAGAETRYVTMSGAGAGTSWDDATPSLQEAIDAVAALGGGEVWVAAGVYIPDIEADSFVLDASVSLYGGFPANAATGSAECDDLADRRPREHLTILSGDRNGDDVTDAQTGLPTIGSMTDNAARVIDIPDMAFATVFVDGFIIEGGNADNAPGSGYNTQCGGGIRAIAGSGYRRTALLVITDCEFYGNRAGNNNWMGGHGGGLYVEQADVTVSESSFGSNAAGDGPDGDNGIDGPTGTGGGDGVAGGNGGGMAILYGTSIMLYEVDFGNNWAGAGGNGGNGGESWNNVGGVGGSGALGGSGGGLYIDMVSSSLLVQRCMFADNRAGQGGNGGAGGDTTLDTSRGGNGGTANAHNPEYYNVSGCGGGMAISYCYSQNALVTSSLFSSNATGEAGEGGLPGNYLGTGEGESGLPGTTFGTGGEGGGLFAFRSSLTLTNTTLTGNKAAGNGGGIALSSDGEGQLAATHLTVFQNTSDSHGGGISLGNTYDMQTPAVHVRNSVLWGNSLTGTGTRGTDSQLYAAYTGMTVANSILAEAPTSVALADCNPSDPDLKALSWNGGPTPTLAPNPGSPIIDATFLDNTVLATEDQRDFPRDDNNPDAGAFEVRQQASRVEVTTVSDEAAVLAWTPGIWAYSVVFIRPDDPGDPKPRPRDGAMYNANPEYGIGGYITETPWCCVYAGTGSAVSITGLQASTKYSVMVCDTLNVEFEYIHNTEDADTNPLVFETSAAIGPAQLVSPIHCPDEGATGPDGDSPLYGHSLIPEPVFVWDPPTGAENAHFQVWLDGFEIGDTAIDPIGFRCFDGTVWSDFPVEGMPPGTQRLAFLRVQASVPVRAISNQASEWFVRTVSPIRRGSSDSETWRFLVNSVGWEDDVLVAGYTVIRKVQMDQLRNEVHALERMRGTAEADLTAFTDPTIGRNLTPIRASHFQELRDAIGRVAANVGEDTASWEWTDPVLAPNQTVIRTTHIQELRDALLGTYPVPAAERR